MLHAIECFSYQESATRRRRGYVDLLVVASTCVYIDFAFAIILLLC